MLEEKTDPGKLTSDINNDSDNDSDNNSDNDNEIDDFLLIIKEQFSNDDFAKYIEVNESDFLTTRIKNFYIDNLKIVLDNIIQQSGNYMDTILVFNVNNPLIPLQNEIFESLKEDLSWGFKKITESELILRSSSLTLTKEGRDFISELINNLEKIKENSSVDCFTISFNDIISIFEDCDIRFELIIKYIAKCIISLKVPNRFSLPDIRKNLKQGIFTNFVISSFFHNKRDKTLKRAKKIIIEFPNFKDEIIKQALLNGKMDFIEDYYLNGELLDVNRGSKFVNRLVYSKKVFTDPKGKELKENSPENNNLLKFISCEENQASYAKTYFRKILGIS